MIELGSLVIYLYGVAVAVAAAAGVLLLLRETRGTKIDAVTLALCTIPCAFAGARLLYCLVRFEFVFIEMGPLFALTTWSGGFLLWGAVAGGMLGAWLYAKRAKLRAANVFDALAAPAMFTIAICRAAEGFTFDEGRGMVLEEGFCCRFPFVVCNEWDEWQLAVFVWEAVAALVIFCIIRVCREENGGKASLALMLYGACQVVFESLRMDSTPRFGFVRVSQVLAAVTLLVCVLWRNRACSATRKAALAGVVLAMVAVAGVLEWAIDKTPVPLPLCYAVMIAAMGVCTALGLKQKKA